MPPIQEHGYEGGYGYDDADWDAGGGAWGRQDGWDVHPSRQRQEQMYDRRQQPQEIIGAPHQGLNSIHFRTITKNFTKKITKKFKKKLSKC